MNSLRAFRNPHPRSAHVFAEALESRRLFDMLYPGDGPIEEHVDEPAEYKLYSKWSMTDLKYSFSNLLDGALPGGLSATVLEAAIEEALQVWSAVSPLRFTEAIDSGPAPSDTGYVAGTHPQLRFGHHYIDGGSGANTLAHAYFPSTNGIGGDLHFDNGNTWTTHPSSGIDIIEVATHEIGHALGIDHEEVNNAIMNPYYGGRYSGPGSAFLLQDDVDGIQAQYGAGLGYVVSDNTLFLSGTAAADALAVDVNGTSFSLSNGTRSVTGAVGTITNIVVNARGGNDTITIKRTGGLAVSVNGGAGTDALTLSDKTGTFAGTYTVNASPTSGNVTITRTALPDLTYSSSESLALEGSDANNTFTVNTSNNVTIRTNGGSDVVNVNTDNTAAASVIFDQPDEHVATLNIGTGGKVTLKSTTTALTNILTVNTINLAPAGKLDLTNGGMIIDYTGTSPADSLDDSLGSAYTYGDWSGNGITSSLAAPLVNPQQIYTVGMASASDVLGLSGTETGDWRGHTVDSTTIMVRFTYTGDANLDGSIDGADYGIIDNYVQFPGTNGFGLGDFNYDGVIDGADYGLIDNAVQFQGVPL
jgi:hypothetical protein